MHVVQEQDPKPATSEQRTNEYCRKLPILNASPDSLSDVCRFALSSERQFPNFICDQITKRSSGIGQDYSRPVAGQINTVTPGLGRDYSRRGEGHSSTVTSTVTYLDGKESYSNIKVDGVPEAELTKTGGMISEGEFVTVLRNLFEPDAKAQFTFVREMTFGKKRSLVFDFTVEGKNSRWKIEAGDHTITPPYHGRLWVSKNPSHVMRLDQQATISDLEAGYKSARVTVDYNDMKLGNRGPFTLPTKSAIEGCAARGGACLRNETRFQNCRKFTAEATMIPAP
jgi:hypothetical protein